MPGNCYRFALETFFDLHAEVSSGSVSVGAGQLAFQPPGGGQFTAIRSAKLPQLGPEPVLVHGFALGQSGEVKDARIEHAWIEGNGCVLDCGALEKELWLTDRDAYYRLGQIDPRECRRYTLDQVIERVLATGKDGGWSAPTDHVAARPAPR